MKLIHGDSAARAVSERIGGSTATTTTLAAVPADRRVDQMLMMCVADNSLWLFDGDSAIDASSSVIEPDAGNGRWILMGVAGAGGIFIVSKTIAFGDVTDAGMTVAVDFDAALPAGALVLGGGANVTAVFDNVGDSASVTFDLGFLTGDTDAIVDAGSLNTAAKVSIPRGAAVPIMPGALTPSIIFDADVNLNTLTKGAAVFYVAYVLAF